MSRAVEWLLANVYPDDIIPGAIWHDGAGLWEVIDIARLLAYIEAYGPEVAMEMARKEREGGKD